MDDPHSLSGLTSYCSSYTGFSMPLEHSRPIPATGPLHILFILPGIFSLMCPEDPLGLYSVSPSQGGFVRNYNSPSLSFPISSCFISLLSHYYHLIYFSLLIWPLVSTWYVISPQTGVSCMSVTRSSHSLNISHMSEVSDIQGSLPRMLAGCSNSCPLSYQRNGKFLLTQSSLRSDPSN